MNEEFKSQLMITGLKRIIFKMIYIYLILLVNIFVYTAKSVFSSFS